MDEGCKEKLPRREKYKREEGGGKKEEGRRTNVHKGTGFLPKR